MDELLALTDDGLFVFAVFRSDDPLLGFPGSDVETITRTKSSVQKPGQQLVCLRSAYCWRGF